MMRTDQRVFVNTLALYAKIGVNIIVSLYLTRVVLNVLGVNDYGIYNLIAGTIAFLAFLNSALSSSSQRYFSVLKGKKDIMALKEYFSSSIIIHIVLSVLFVVIFEIAYLFLFDGFFNIQSDKIYEAKMVYQLTCLSMIATVYGVPYTSVINANEDLVFFAVVETVCSILKLCIIWLFKIPEVNLLIIYAAWITFVTILGVVIKWYWCKRKYPECRSNNFKYDKSIISNMLSFSGWNALGAFAMMCRNQGVAFVINIFFGTAINAVYGIANQVNGQLCYFSQMLSASFAPQIMKSVGEGNYDKLRFLSVFSSKIAFYMSAVLAIPLILEIDFILKIWLKNVPLFTSEFCTLIVYVFLILQLYPGIVRAILAVGKIRNYQIVISVLLVMPIIVGILLYKEGFASYSICYVMIAAQFLTLLATTYFANKYYSLSLSVFYRFVVSSVTGFVLTIVVFKTLGVVTEQWHPFGKFVLNTFASMMLFSAFYYMIVLDSIEKTRLKNLLLKF
ncbi:MAG: hypothetical protein K2M96_05190 [Prevotella sp.]|nr:hypothetical protein [Prevotella sp.]